MTFSKVSILNVLQKSRFLETIWLLLFLMFLKYHEIVRMSDFWWNILNIVSNGIIKHLTYGICQYILCSIFKCIFFSIALPFQSMKWKEVKIKILVFLLVFYFIEILYPKAYCCVCCTSFWIATFFFLFYFLLKYWKCEKSRKCILHESLSYY